MEAYAPADQGGYKPGMSPHEKYHCWAATQYKAKVRRMRLDWQSLIYKLSSLTPTSLGSRGRHQHLRKDKQLTPRAGHPLHKAYGSRALECAQTPVMNIPHRREFRIPPTPLQSIPIRRLRMNNTSRGSGRLMHCVLTICHPPKVDVIRASEARPRRHQVPGTRPFNSHPVRFPRSQNYKRIPWVH